MGAANGELGGQALQPHQQAVIAAAAQLVKDVK